MARSYDDVAGLRDAYVAAGGACSGYAERQVTLAASAADCDSATVLMVFVGKSQRDAAISNLSAYSLLVGPNWLVNSTAGRIARVRHGLGGVVWKPHS